MIVPLRCGRFWTHQIGLGHVDFWHHFLHLLRWQLLGLGSCFRRQHLNVPSIVTCSLCKEWTRRRHLWIALLELHHYSLGLLSAHGTAGSLRLHLSLWLGLELGHIRRGSCCRCRCLCIHYFLRSAGSLATHGRSLDVCLRGHSDMAHLLLVLGRWSTLFGPVGIKISRRHEITRRHLHDVGLGLGGCFRC